MTWIGVDPAHSERCSWHRVVSADGLRMSLAKSLDDAWSEAERLVPADRKARIAAYRLKTGDWVVIMEYEP